MKDKEKTTGPTDKERQDAAPDPTATGDGKGKTGKAHDDEKTPEGAKNASDGKTEATATEPTPEELKRQVEDLKDKYLRKAAEFENFRKRTVREKTELLVNGGEKVISSLLPVVDDMERARKMIAAADDVEALRKGLELVFEKFRKVLSEQGLRRIEWEGKKFDTDFHEAVAMVPTADKGKKGFVVDCVEAGYTLNGKVIRHAKVAVGQ